MKNLILYWMPPLVWLGIIWSLSSLPASNMPEQPFDLFDKVAHFGVFGFLGFLVFRAGLFALEMRMRRAMIFAFLSCSFYALLDEYHQTYIPGRQADLSDILADVLGIATAVVFGKLMYEFKEQWSERKKSDCGATGDVTTS